MRLSAELLGVAEQRPNPLGEREIVLRGLGVPSIEHLAATRDAFDAIDLADNRISRIENFPRLNRLSSLVISGNDIESIDADNLRKNTPNIQNLILSNNRISSLHEIGNIGKACTKLEFLCLSGNPVTRRQHYRLYAIQHIPSLRVLDMIKVKQAEREKAERLAKSAAGAALESDVKLEAREAESKTFVPGQGKTAEESFKSSFTSEQKDQIRKMVENASSPAVIEQIEDSVQRGVFPSFLLQQQPNGETGGTGIPPPPLAPENEIARKRLATDNSTENGEGGNAKKTRVDSSD
mmetsp:Transcript_25790/g.36152  ORF Transcript_25790/g.36152 Transcript_25790/m.36152 type:complete len:294 (+) Transcript_25790:119-1000(+)